MQGQFTKAGLSDLKAAGKHLRKIGQRTCYSEGDIKAVDGFQQWIDDGCGDRSEQVFWGTDDSAAGGDSGSPTFHPDPESDDYYLIASLHAGITPAWLSYEDEGYAFGTSGYGIKDKHGFEFA